jgi:hypothetical protein
MTRRGAFLLVLAGGALAGLLSLVVVLGHAFDSAADNPKPPDLAGQPVPAAPHEIRFDVPCHVYCTFFRDEPTVFRDCRIVGFTGRSDGQGARFGFSSEYGRHFDQWLVLKLADGRLVYIPPSAVRYIEESSAAGTAVTSAGDPP